MNVTLTWSEYEVGAYVGFRRGLEVVQSGRPDDDGETRRMHIGSHVDGAVAENVVAKLLDLHWPALQIPNTLGDLIDPTGRWLEIRHTRLENGCLPLHPPDNPEAFAVLVRGRYPVFDVVGGIRIKFGRIKQFWRGDLDRPCFLVPADRLIWPDHWPQP